MHNYRILRMKYYKVFNKLPGNLFLILPITLLTLLSFKTQGQTIAFSDDFSANNSSSWTTSGSISSTDWNVNRRRTDWGARRTSGRMELTNDASGSSNRSGWVFAYIGSSTFNCYSDVLSDNAGTVTWNFNMRQIRSNPSGFGSNRYGVAFVLAGSDEDVYDDGNGYAVVLGQSGSTDPVRLVRYNNGLEGTLTNIISSNTSGLTDFGNQYLSVRVIYTPSTNTWELLLRNDGSGNFANPAAGVMVSQGTATNSTYTGNSLEYMGAYWQGSTSSNQTAFFDNISVILQSPSGPTQPSTVSGSTTVCGGSSQTYSVTNVAGVTYNWALPSGWSGTSTTNSINVISGSSSGTITITPSNSCGTGTARTLSVTVSGTAPTNELCANATTLACGTSAFAGSTECTSNTAHGTGYTISNYGVWYTFQGDGGSTTISTTALAGFDHALAILSGSCGGFTQIAYSDLYYGGTESYTFNTVNGTTYYVYVAYYTNGSTTGDFTISRTCNNISFASGNQVTSDTVCENTSFKVYGTNIDNDICTYSGSINYGYYWYYSADNGANWSLLPGITYTADGMGIPVTIPQNSPTFSGLPAGTYWISRDYYHNTCDYSYFESNYLTLVVISGSTAPAAISGITPICNGDSVTLTASGGSAGDGAIFQWYAGSCGGGTLLGTSASITVSPTTTTTYFVRRSDNCNTTTCVSATVTVNQPSANPSVNYTLANGDYLWNGNISNNYTTAANWYIFNGTGYTVAASAPSSSDNVYIVKTQQCVTNSNPSLSANNLNLKNIYIDSAAVFTVSGSNNLNVSGNWMNKGTFTANNSTITFNGTNTQTISSGMGNSSTPVAGKSFYKIILNKTPDTSQVFLSENLNVTSSLEIEAGEFYIPAAISTFSEQMEIDVNGKLNLAGELRINQ